MATIRTASLGVDNTEEVANDDSTRLSTNGKEVPLKTQSSLPGFTPDVNEIDLAKGGLPPNPVNMERLVSEVRCRFSIRYQAC
jgi:hypothetical protein